MEDLEKLDTKIYQNIAKAKTLDTEFKASLATWLDDQDNIDKVDALKEKTIPLVTILKQILIFVKSRVQITQNWYKAHPSNPDAFETSVAQMKQTMLVKLEETFITQSTRLGLASDLTAPQKDKMKLRMPTFDTKIYTVSLLSTNPLE